MGLWRRGATSCGGSCHLVRARDALRGGLPPTPTTDMDTVPAWLELDDVPPNAPALWDAVARAVAGRDPDELRGTRRAARSARLEGGRGRRPTRRGARRTRECHRCARSRASGWSISPALWAGPLCGDLLAGAGAKVTKVESTSRPDGARRGPPRFFDLHERTQTIGRPRLHERPGPALLARLVRQSDVVIEASRPRALEQLGIGGRGGDPRRPWDRGRRGWRRASGVDLHHRPRARTAPADRVAFGDDAAAAGGLVVWRDGAPPSAPTPWPIR